MAKRLKFLHVTVVGAGVSSASVEFGEKLTVVHGASDTGKSHILDLVAYAFGLSKSIDLPQEAKGYRYVLLGLAVEGKGNFTLCRDLEGGKIGVYGGDVRDAPSQPAPLYLKPNHTAKDPLSVSRYVLSLIDLDERFVRRNQNNDTRMVQLRDVFRLSAVGEEKILSKKSPIEFGQYSDQTVEASIFRLFIEGSDDSGMVPIPKTADLKRIAANKLEVLEVLIADLETQLENVAPIDDLRSQLVRVNASLEDSTAEIEGTSRARDQLVSERSSLVRDLASLDDRYDEVVSLTARFGLLHEQYDSDLGRLDMLAQAGGILGVMSGEACPFCGSAPEHQHWPHAEGDTSAGPEFLAAVESERAKIAILRTDLAQTLSSLGEQRETLEQERRRLIEGISRLSATIEAQELRLRAPGESLSRIVEVRSDVENSVRAYEQLSQLLALRDAVSRVEKPAPAGDMSISAADLSHFDTLAREILASWRFASNGGVHFSRKDRDIVVDQRPRSGRGKGVRSILHALFNVSLAEFCMRFDRPHLGLVVLDSPVVTYRQPEDPELGGEDETIATSVVDAFYWYLQNEFKGQSIILENTSPVSPLPSGSIEYFFGGPEYGAGRKGFYPTSADD